jgi:hypothetical protein
MQRAVKQLLLKLILMQRAGKQLLLVTVLMQRAVKQLPSMHPNMFKVSIMY